MVYAIIVIAFIILFFGYLITSYIYKKLHHLPTGECACCANKMKKAVSKAKHDLHTDHTCSCGCRELDK